MNSWLSFKTYMNNSLRWQCIVGAAVTVLPMASAVPAEQVYVSDKLVANITDQASQDGKRVTTVETGDVLDVLARDEGYVQVRTAKGNEGWIKTNYVTSQMPAARRLKELEAAQASSDNPSVNVSQYTQEIAQLHERNKALIAELAVANKAVDEARAAGAVTTTLATTTLPASSTEIATAESTVEPSIASPTANAERWSAMKVAVVVATYLTAAMLGFMWGYKTLSAKIRRKYGRMKIV